MSDNQTKGERTRQTILDAAYSLFVEQGYHATSMRQIAQRSGLALGGIYNHFDNKEQIFETVLIENHPYRQVLQILLAAPGDSVQELAYNAAHTMLAEMGKDSNFLKLAFIELSEFKGRHISILFKIIFPEIFPLFERFKERESELRPLPLEIVFFSFVGTFFSYFIINNLVVPTSEFSLKDEALEQFIDIYLHGVIDPSQMSSKIPGYTPEIQGLEDL